MIYDFLSPPAEAKFTGRVGKLQFLLRLGQKHLISYSSELLFKTCHGHLFEAAFKLVFDKLEEIHIFIHTPFIRFNPTLQHLFLPTP